MSEMTPFLPGQNLLTHPADGLFPLGCDVKVFCYQLSEVVL